MPAHQILEEAGNLYKVSKSLETLARQHEHLAEALTVLSGTVRNSATLLEVLVTVKLSPEPCSDSTSN
jgi:hypothetical protein